MSDTYCNEPWRTVHYDEVGRLGPCCTYRGQRSTAISVDEYLNSTWLHNFRKDLLNGKRPPGCRNCWIKEDRGESSQRTEKNARYGYTTETDIKELFLSFGNICNKTCNICRPQRSSLLAKEYRQIDPNNEWLQQKLLDQPRLKNSLEKDYSGQYLDRLEDYHTALDHADIIHLDGGEPFIVAQCDKILDYMIDNGMTNKHIKATTNGSLSVEQLDKLVQFDRVSLTLSIDGIEELYPIVRPPHSWAWWQNQHARIKQYTKIHISYACVAHAFNVHQLPRIYEYFTSDPRDSFYFSQLNNQEYLGCNVVPDDVIDASIEQLKHIEHSNVKNIVLHLQKSKQINIEKNKYFFKKYIETFSPIKNLDYTIIPWISNE